MFAVNNQRELDGFLEILGLTEEPIGVYYTDQQPKEGVCPKQRRLGIAVFAKF